MFRNTNFGILIRKAGDFYGFNWHSLDYFCFFAKRKPMQWPDEKVNLSILAWVAFTCVNVQVCVRDCGGDCNVPNVLRFFMRHVRGFSCCFGHARVWHVGTGRQGTFLLPIVFRFCLGHSCTFILLGILVWRTKTYFWKRPSLGGDDSQRAAESELVFLELVCKSCLMLAGPHHLSRVVLCFPPLSWPNRSFHPNHYSLILASLGGDEVGI